MNAVSQSSDLNGNKMQFQAGNQEQIQGVGVTGNPIGCPTNIRALNCMQGNAVNSGQSSIMENKHHQRSQSIRNEHHNAQEMKEHGAP